MILADTFVGLYARPRTPAEHLRVDRWYGVWVKSRMPDQIFTCTDASENIPLNVNDCDFSLEPVNLYTNPLLPVAEIDMDSLDDSAKECIENYIEDRPTRTHIEVTRQSGLSNRWLDVSFRDYSFSVPVEIISNPRTGTDVILETPERVQETLKAGSLIGTSIWFYDQRSLGGNMVEHFRDLGHCLVRVTSFDFHRPKELYVTSGNTVQLARHRHTLVPDDMEIKEGMWVLPRGGDIPEIVMSVGNDYITTKRGENRGLSYMETLVRPLTPTELKEAEEAMKPKPLTEAMVIELLGPTLHDMIMRFPNNMFTRGTVFQRIQDQLPKDCDTGEKILAYIIANPGPMVNVNLNWPKFDTERSFNLWAEWIDRVNALAPNAGAVNEPPDDEMVKMYVKFKRSGIEFRRERLTEVFEGELDVPYGEVRQGRVAIEEYLEGTDPELAGLSRIRDNRRVISRDREDDETEIELVDFNPVARSEPHQIVSDVPYIATAQEIRMPPRPAWTLPTMTAPPAPGQIDRNMDAIQRIRTQLEQTVAMPATWPGLGAEERMTAREIEAEDDRTIRELFGEGPLERVVPTERAPDPDDTRDNRPHRQETEEERPF